MIPNDRLAAEMIRNDTVLDDRVRPGVIGWASGGRRHRRLSLAGVYGTAEQLGLIVLFNAVMFVLAEVPLVGYLVQPEATAERVASFATWLSANGLRVMAGWSVRLASA